MNRQCKIRYIMMLLSYATTTWAFPVVEWGTVSGGGDRDSFTLSTYLSGSGDAGIEGNSTPNDQLGNILLLVEGGTVSIAHSWFQVIYGSLVDEFAWQSATDYFADIGDSYELGSLTLTAGESLYLGFRLDSQGFTPYNREYGWVELLYDGFSVSVVSSATERTGLGIYAGTGTAIPEPTTVGMMIMGAAGLLFRRRMPKHM